MGNTSSSNNLLNFEDMQQIMNGRGGTLLINTLTPTEQACLIPTTIEAIHEEQIINQLLQSKQTNRSIVIYGKNANDETIRKKYKQLTNMGFQHVFIYLGGMFEWIMLQDIYGKEEFPTTSNELDILKFKPPRRLQNNLITNYA